MNKVLPILGIACWLVAANVYVAMHAVQLIMNWPVWRECHGAVAPACMFHQLLVFTSVILGFTFWAGALAAFILWLIN